MSKEIEICPECGGRIIFSYFKKICDKCGLIIENNAYKIDYKKKLIPSNIYDTLKVISVHLNLNRNIKHNAAYYYRKVLEADKKVSNNISLLAFCLFHTIRKHYSHIQIKLDDITKAFQKFGYNLNSESILKEGIKYKTYFLFDSSANISEDYIVRLVKNVINHPEIHERITKLRIKWLKSEYHKRLLMKCREILKELPFNQRGARNPFTLTGGIIYLADKLLAQEFKQKPILTQRLISEATGIAEYSIKDYYINLLKPIFINRK
ncbi:MAG: hypothetical protein ACFFA0_05895 [Promethearchaeota archaeon]